MDADQTDLEVAIEGCLKEIPFAIHIYGIESRMMYKVEYKKFDRILFGVESSLRRDTMNLYIAGWPHMEQEES